MTDWYDELTRPGLVRPVRTDPLGLSGPTPAQARHPRWRRSSRGMYVPREVDETLPEQRIVEAAAVAPEVSGVTGWAGLRWLGASWFDGQDGRTGPRSVVIVTADANVRSQAGIEVSQERLAIAEVVYADGVPVTVPTRSACFEARYAASIVDAVIAWDMAAFADLTSLDEAAEYCRWHSGWTGIPQARAALALAVENSWSPMETRLRLAWLADPRRPVPLCNVPVFDLNGRHLGTPDLLDPVAGVVGEYDGSLHLEGVRRGRDLAREQVLRDHGLEPFTVVAGDLGVQGRVFERIASAYRRAETRRSSRLLWTIEPPAWWEPTLTVADRRRLALQGKSHLLPNRRWAA